MNPIIDIDLHQEKQNYARIGVVQLDLNDFFERKDGLCIPKDDFAVKEKYFHFLSKAKELEVNIICFPELSFSPSMRDELKGFVNETGMIVIGGSFYNAKRKNVCPIIIPGHEKIYYNEKINLSPVGEESPYADERPISGENIYVVKNSLFGSFGVLICADYLDDELKTLILKKNVDILFVVSLNNKSEDWHINMNQDCKKNKEGVYLVYSNSVMGKFANGKSAIFGLIHESHVDPKLNYSVQFKFMEIIDENLIVADFNIRNKKPSDRPNTIKVGSTLKPIYPYFTRKEKELQTFFNIIGLTEKRYREIDKLYVPPTNFKSIYEKLKTEKIVFLIGDPEMGKTYTSFKLLLDSYREGYEPVYEEKSGSETRILKINELNADKKAIYFEDPWGTTNLKCEDILQDICELLENVSKYDTRIIITSRKKIIQRVEEIIDNLCDLSSHIEELNIKEAYDLGNLKNLFEKYLEVFKPKWRENPRIKNLVYTAIDNQTLKTPMSIQKVIESNEGIHTENEGIISNIIVKSSEKTDISFGSEIKSIYRQKDYDKIVFLCFLLISPFEIEFINKNYTEFLRYLNKKHAVGTIFKDFNSVFEWFHKEVESYSLSDNAILKFSHDSYRNGCAHAVFTNNDIYKNIFYPILQMLSEDPNPDIRFKISNYLLNFLEKFPDIPEDLICRFCDDTNPDVKITVGNIIAKKFDNFNPDFVGKILKKLSKDKDIDVKIAIGEKFVENFGNSPEATEIFIRNLSDYDREDVKNLTLDLFYQIYSKYPDDAKTLLNTLSNDHEDDVRMTACDIIEKYHYLFRSLAEKLLLELSDDLDYNIKSSSSKILAENFEDHSTGLEEDDLSPEKYEDFFEDDYKLLEPR